MIDKDFIKKNDNSVITVENGVYSIKFREFMKYESDILHGFSTRLGGVSKGHYSTMNLGFTRGDNPEDVIENHKRFARSIGYDYNRIVMSHQTHTVNVHVCTEEDAGKGVIRPTDILDTDGLITNVKNLPLMSLVADCVPIMLYDPVKKVIGIAHSGWKGTAGKIAKNVVIKMNETFSSEPYDIKAVICPSICRECYEVGEEIIEEFISAFEPRYYDALFYRNENDRFQLDLHEACRIALMEAGLKKDNIILSGICTGENSERMFSHRKTAFNRGNLAAVIMLR